MVIERTISSEKSKPQNDIKPSIGELESILPPPPPLPPPLPSDLDFGEVCLLKDSPFRLIKVSVSKITFNTKRSQEQENGLLKRIPQTKVFGFCTFFVGITTKKYKKDCDFSYKISWSLIFVSDR